MGIRIVHWYPNCLGGGGVANAVLGLARSQVRLGAEVVVAAAKLSGPPLYGPLDIDPDIVVVPWQPRWTCRVAGAVLRGLPRDVARRLRAFTPDVVHVHAPFNPDNLWVPFLFRCPMVFSPHGGFHPQVFTQSRRMAKRLYFGMEQRLLHRRVAAFHALSAAEREDIARLMPGKRVYCVPQTSNLPTELSLVRDVQRGSGDGVSFVFVGRLDVFTKGLDILLEAFACAERRLGGQEVTLTLVGPEWGGSLAWLQKRAQELGIAHRVVFPGTLSRGELTLTLRRSGIYVQLSRHDAFPLSVIEALLAGKPAILSSAVGLASYQEVASLPHVRVVPPRTDEAAEAMVDFARRVGELKKIAEHYRPKVEDFFSWERAARLHLEAYEKIRAETA